MLAEAAAIFVVPVEQEDAQVRPGLEDFLQQQRDAARLADAGGAEHGKMLAQHLVHVDMRGDRDVLLEMADIDRVNRRDVVDEPQFGAADQVRRVADRRIFADAALEILLAACVRLDLAHQVDARRAAIAAFARDRGRLHGHFRDHADEQRGAPRDAEKLADRDRGFVEGLQAGFRQSDARLRAMDRQDAPCGLHGFVRTESFQRTLLGSVLRSNCSPQ